MVSAICKAKNPATCPYHGAVLRMNAAALADPPDFNTYFEARNEVEKHEKAGWDETKYLEQLKLTPTTSSRPVNGNILTNHSPEAQRGVLLKTLAVELPDSDNPIIFKLKSDKNNNVIPEKSNYIRIQTDRKLSKEQMEHLSGLLRYTYRTTIVGERLSEPYPDTPYSFIVKGDPTKAKRTDLHNAFNEFESLYPQLITTGTPIRNTDRSGPNTKGTRSINAYPEPVKIAYYYGN